MIPSYLKEIWNRSKDQYKIVEIAENVTEEQVYEFYQDDSDEDFDDDIDLSMTSTSTIGSRRTEPKEMLLALPCRAPLLHEDISTSSIVCEPFQKISTEKSRPSRYHTTTEDESETLLEPERNEFEDDEFQPFHRMYEEGYGDRDRYKHKQIVRMDAASIVVTMYQFLFAKVDKILTGRGKNGLQRVSFYSKSV